MSGVRRLLKKEGFFCDLSVCPDICLVSVSWQGQTICNKRLWNVGHKYHWSNPHLPFCPTKTFNKYICSCGTFRTIYKNIPKNVLNLPRVLKPSISYVSNDFVTFVSVF